MHELTLTPELQEALANRPGQPLRVTDPASHADYVLIDASAFDQIARLSYDDSPWTDEEKQLLAAEAGARIGWDDMSEYDHYPDAKS